MSIFRTIALFIYLFGYMIVHYGALRRGERALAAGDTQLVEELVNKNIPRWSRGILKVTGVSLVVEGLENIPKDTACVFVGNHRSYYDIPLLLASLDKPHGVLAKEELEKIPLLNRWMKLLGCVFVQRDDLRASVRALNDATAIVEGGKSFIIFPEGTRYKGEEGGAGERAHQGAAAYPDGQHEQGRAEAAARRRAPDDSGTAVKGEQPHPLRLALLDSSPRGRAKNVTVRALPLPLG